MWQPRIDQVLRQRAAAADPGRSEAIIESPCLGICMHSDLIYKRASMARPARHSLECLSAGVGPQRAINT
jgi:hypothetical protein